MSALQKRFDELRETYPPSMHASLVLPLLHAVQEDKGFVSDEDAQAVAQFAGVPTMQVMEALTWYSMLRREAVGRHVLKVCRNLSCSLRGAERLIDHLQRKLRVAPGETTADGRFTLQTVECLASCGKAPSMQVNEAHYDELNEAKLDRLLEALP